MSHCNPSRVPFTSGQNFKGSRTEGSIRQSKAVESTLTDFTVRAIKFDIYKNKEKRADVDILGRLLWLPGHLDEEPDF